MNREELHGRHGSHNAAAMTSANGRHAATERTPETFRTWRLYMRESVRTVVIEHTEQIN